MKLSIFGGSTAAGFGVKDRSYGALIAERLGLEFDNVAGPSAQITDSIEWVDRAVGASVVLVMHGSGEALVRPTERSLRFLPRRWRRRGWMDPRPYYSSKFHKRVPQRIESAVRWRIKVALIRSTGGESLIELDEYLATTLKFIREVKSRGVDTIVFVGSAAMDARYFPLSAEKIALYDAATRQLAESEGAIFVDVLGACVRWDDYFGDHLHPTVSGHVRLADQIITQMQAAGALPATDSANAA